MTISNNIKAVNEHAKKVHGKDIVILVARAVAFGHDDNLVIIQGKNHHAAALDFVKTVKGATIEEEFVPEMDWGDGDVTPAHTQSIVRF